MDEKPGSPYNFTNLDSSLIRSTKRTAPSSPPSISQQQSPEIVVNDHTPRHPHRLDEQRDAIQTDVHNIQPHATVPPQAHAPTLPSSDSSLIAEVHKAVKQIGRFEGTHRYTEEEKDGLDEIIRTCKKKRIRTSENEIARIGINVLLEDYRRNGEQSILAQVLKSLHQ